MFSISTGAGFLPSTVWMCDLVCFSHGTPSPPSPRSSRYLRSFPTKNPPQAVFFCCRPKHHLRTQQENLGICKKELTWALASITKKIPSSIPMSTNLVLKKLAKLLAREIYSQVLKSCSNGHCTVSPNKKSKDWHLYIFFFFYSYIYIHVYISIYTISSQSFRWHYPNANPTNNFETTLG